MGGVEERSKATSVQVQQYALKRQQVEAAFNSWAQCTAFMQEIVLWLLSVCCWGQTSPCSRAGTLSLLKHMSFLITSTF